MMWWNFPVLQQKFKKDMTKGHFKGYLLEDGWKIVQDQVNGIEKVIAYLIWRRNFMILMKFNWMLIDQGKMGQDRRRFT